MLFRSYEEVTGEEFPKPASDDNLLRNEDWNILREVCGEDEAFFELQSRLLDIEREYRGMSRRVGIFEALEDRLRLDQYGNEAEALAVRRLEEERRREADEFGMQHESINMQKTLFTSGEAETVENV